VVLIGILVLISDDDDPYGIVAHLMDVVPSGSYLVITHPASDVNAEVVAEGARRYNQSVATQQTRRSFVEVTRFFKALDVVEPGVVQCHRGVPGRGRPQALASVPAVSSQCGLAGVAFAV
jgi:hypothetical protein